jgi:hypothetical protein
MTFISKIRRQSQRPIAPTSPDIAMPAECTSTSSRRT